MNSYRGRNSMPNYAIMDNKVIEILEPMKYSGIVHIVGKRTAEDRKYIMKVDPSLVKEKIQGKESGNLGREPTLIYDLSNLVTREKKFDSWGVNTVFFIFGVVAGAMLYYWRMIEYFAR